MCDFIRRKVRKDDRWFLTILMKCREAAIASFSEDGILYNIAVTQDGKIVIAGESSGKVYFLRPEEDDIIPETQSGHIIACPKCSSDDVTFSKKMAVTWINALAILE